MTVTSLSASMPVLVLDELARAALLAERRRMGGDRYDEVWEGTYVMNPLASVEHQRLVMRLSAVLDEIVRGAGLGEVLPGANVSDRLEGWESNYRCPDIVVLLNGSRAVDAGPVLVGGPDFLVEVRSPGDQTLEKIPFYENLGVRELLVVERDSKDLQLFVLSDGKLQPQELRKGATGHKLVSLALGIAFVHESASGRNSIGINRLPDDGRNWIL